MCAEAYDPNLVNQQLQSYLHNRTASQDLDYFISPTRYGDCYDAIRRELKRIIAWVANQLSYDIEWCNDQVRLFTNLLNQPEDLFNRSVQQGILLYGDHNLVIHAVLWEWVLVRKLKRLQMEGQPQREQDWSDCLAVTKILCDRETITKGTRLSQQILTEFDHTQREPPVYEPTITALRSIFSRKYRFDPFPESEIQQSQASNALTTSTQMTRLTTATTAATQECWVFRNQNHAYFPISNGNVVEGRPRYDMPQKCWIYNEDGWENGHRWKFAQNGSFRYG